jgi:hypothetical protein
MTTFSQFPMIELPNGTIVALSRDRCATALPTASTGSWRMACHEINGKNSPTSSALFSKHTSAGR